MKLDKDIRDSLFVMFDYMFGDNRLNFGFPGDADRAYLQAYMNNNPRPDDKTLLYYYVDNLDDWKQARHAGQTTSYNKDTGISTQEMMRQFDCVVDVYSKIPGGAMDAISFLIAALRGDRWENLMLSDGWFLGKESVSAPIPIREIDNSTWTNRCRCVIKLNFHDEIKLKDPMRELQMPKVITDMNTITPFEGNDLG